MSETEFYVRVDEADKTPAQISQRRRTYEAAALLRKAGYPCEVVEFFTGKSERADAAGIRLRLDTDG